ncbi:sensor histidine kinase [uncultured Roseibium sp.]|uniref:sensor histidine kinase n=1 Tax=uncultured Roseibium sp. TaxID=1936171 RepID=UPI00321691EC
MRKIRDAAAALSLTARVALAVGSLLLIGGVVVSLAAFAYGREAARETYDRLLVGAANDIAESITIVNGAPVVDLPMSAFQLLALAPDDRISYRVVGVNGETLTGYDDLALPDKRGRGDTSFFNAAFFGEPARYAIVTRRFAERSLNGTVHVIVGQTLLARNALALDMTRSVLFGLIVSGTLLLLLAVLVVRSALKPLARIGEAFVKRDPHDLTPMDTQVPREAAVMIEALNGFMARLDRQFSAMQNLISDTAHQLRTPVAALRAQADLAAEETEEDRRQAIVERIHRRSVSLGQLLDQMLSRALVLHRTDSARREVLDLRNVALEVLDSGDLQLLAPETDIQLDIGEVPVPVLADSPSLCEAAKNLLTNAVRYGRAPVRLGVSRDGETVMLWVEDQGDGPPEAVRNSLGERFVRSAASDGQSAGLGLSIAKSVAEAFNGRLEFKDGDPSGFRIALVFPPVEAPS